MKRLLIIATAMLFCVTATAQIRTAKKKDYDNFKKSTTLLVKDQNPFADYNQRLFEEMQRFWTITPFDVITFQEFEKKRNDNKYSFIILADIKQENLPHVYQFLNFVMGHPTKDFDKMPDLGSVPLSYRDIDEDNYLYKMGIFVQYMQRQALERSLIRNFSLTKLLEVKDGQVKNMELWLLEDELAPDVNTVEKIAQYYPYTVKIVTRDEIQQAITEQREDVAILHKIGPEDTLQYGKGKTWKFIVTVKDAHILYTHSHEVDKQKPDAFLSSDFKNISR
ncbi:MAG: hypothetical protein KGZ97_10620 [Bacteroidetes bacterium]|nr:hypothetical protein [Bacteroidota bacterium]